MRYCPDCKRDLPESEFYVASWRKDGSPGYRNVCKTHYNKRRSHPELSAPIARKLQSRSEKSRRRAAFKRILAGVGK